MRCIQIGVTRATFAAALGAMRGWLDLHGNPAVRFETASQDGEILITVEFPSDDLAEAFQREFGGARPAAA